MAHKLSTYDANHDHLSTRSFDDRSDAFDAYDRACHGDNPRVVWVELTGDGVNRVHRIEAPRGYQDEVREAAAAGGEDRERADDAPAVGGEGGPGPVAPAVAAAATDTVVSVKPSKGKTKGGARTSHG